MKRSTMLWPKLLAGVAGFAAVTLMVVGVVPVAGASSRSASSSRASHKALSQVNLKAVEKRVKAAAAVPSFTKYAHLYGTKIKDPSALKGKKVMIIPGDSEIGACAEQAQAASDLAKAAGMSPSIFSTTGLPSNLVSGVNAAISEKDAAILFECDFTPTTVAPSIAKAEAAGIVVGGYGGTKQEDVKTKLDWETATQWGPDASLGVDQAIAQHGGKPFQALALTANTIGTTPIFTKTLRSEMSKLCPKCTVTYVNINVPTWATKITSTVESALSAHPKITVVFVYFGSMTSFALTGIEGVHRTSTVKTYLSFGGDTTVGKLQVSGPGHAVIQGGISTYATWTGYLDVLQMARVLEHEKPIPFAKAYGPSRIVTPQNAANLLKTGGFGTSFVNGFRKLLGVKALSGSALTNAATITGKMTAKG